MELLLESGKPIRLSDKPILDRFWKLEYDRDNPPLYLADPMHAELENRTNMRYIITPMDMDEILVVYKVTKTMGKEYIHVIDKPISLNGDAAHEKAMIEQLRLQKVIFLFAERHMELYRNVKRKDNYDNYSPDIEQENTEKFSNGEWRRYARVNLFINNPSEYRLVHTPDFSEISDAVEKCRKAWWSCKGESSKDPGLPVISRSESFTDGRVMHFAVFHKNICLAHSMEIVNYDKSYSTSLYFSHIGRNPELTPDGCDKTLLNELDKCRRYASGTWLLEHGITRKYCLGFGPGRSNIRRHKETVCDGKIKYYTGE